MRFQIFIAVVLAQIGRLYLLKQEYNLDNEENRDSEAIYSEVMSNVSRVNNVLRELIRNYEHLRKIHKSEKGLENSDEESDEDDKYQISNEKSKENVTPYKQHPVTQMILSDDDNMDHSETGSTESNDSETEAKDSQSEVKLVYNPQLKTNKKKQIETDNKFNEVDKPKHKEGYQYESKIQQAEPQLKHITTSNNNRNKIKVTKETSFSNLTTIPFLNGVLKEYQTRYKVLQGEEDYSKGEETTLEQSKIAKKASSKHDRNKTVNSTAAPTNNVQKNTYVEWFSLQKLWDNIVGNKPLKLRAHSEVTFDDLRKDGRKDNSRKNKSRKHSRNNKTETKIKIKKQPRTTNTSITDSSSENDDKEEFQAMVLREAYGDACLKLVVRKCYKACKDAGKSVCERFKCKSSYKETYKKHSTEGCLKEFNAKTNKEKGSAEKVFILSGVGDNKEDSRRNLNAREYLNTCLPHIDAGRRRYYRKDLSVDYTNSSLHPTQDLQTSFNILRDRYEKECQKISYRKCKNACHYAYTKTCESFTCNSSRRKAYRKACSSKCKKIYKVKRSSGSSSTDSDVSTSSGSASD